MASSQSRKLRRAAAHLQRKLDRKIRSNGFLPLIDPLAAEETKPQEKQDDPSPVVPPPPAPAAEREAVPKQKTEISQRRLEANRANSLLSTGPKLPETKAISAQNRTTHGLASHKKEGGANAPFKLLTTEEPAGFEALKASLTAEHAPVTETESILVNGMAESHWLSVRAQRLQDTCIDPDSGVITDQKAFALYLRYQTTHTRAFHKSLSDLLKLRAEKRKSEIGFEAQRVRKDQLEMKKAAHELNVLRKDVETYTELVKTTVEILRAKQEFSGFEAEFEAQLQNLKGGKAA